MTRISLVTGWIKRFSSSPSGGFLSLYLAFVAAGFVATMMLFGLFSAFPRLDPDTVYLKAGAFSSVDGPIALFIVWLAGVPVFVWNKCTRRFIVYYGKRLEEFTIVMFAALLGAVVAIGSFGLGWEDLPDTVFYSVFSLFISLTARSFAPMRTVGKQAIVAFFAFIALGLFLTGPALWPAWFLNYVTL